MSTLDDPVLNGNNVPPEGYLNNYIFDGTLESIKVRLKAIGWDGKQPRASVLIHFEDKQVRHVQLVSLDPGILAGPLLPHSEDQSYTRKAI